MSETARVLLINDNLVLQKLAEWTLRREGIDVLSVARFPSLTDLVFQPLPNLILVNSHLDGVAVSGFLEQLQQHPDCGAIPIILLSSKGDESITVQRRPVGVMGFVKMPVDSRELIDVVKRYIKITPLPEVAAQSLEALPPVVDTPDPAISSDAAPLAETLLPSLTVLLKEEVLQETCKQVEERVEPLVRKLLPQAIATVLTQEMLEEMIEKWVLERLPSMAERAIENEIKRLESE